ncbi:MAG: arginine deiminase family protein [Bacteroidales bacterium]
MPNFSQYNETDILEQVIIGRYDTYCNEPEYTERVNIEQLKGLPSVKPLRQEMEIFRDALEKEGVEVLVPDQVGKFVYDQLTPRDIGVTIGQEFLLCNMARKSRRYECAGIFRYINKKSDNEPEILIPDSPDMLMEGGDIIVDKGKIFVAHTERTNKEGIKYIQDTFGSEFEVIPLETRSKSKGENILHLDCMFNPVGEHYAVIYESGFKNIPKPITDSYELISISKEEQTKLAANFLSLSQTKIINRKHPNFRHLHSVLREKGIDVIELPFDTVNSTGGSFRCVSLPLKRLNNGVDIT